MLIGKGIFYLFILAIGAWTASLTVAEVRVILPNDPITPYLALCLFDGGAIAWLTAWAGHARGTAQRAISLTMLVIDLAGVALLSAGRLFMGGQTLTEAPENLGMFVVYGIAISTILNLAAAYAFHIADPEIIEQIETGILEDTLREEAQEQARASIESEARQLGGILASRATAQLKYRLRLPMGQAEINAIDPADLTDEQEPAQIIPAILAQPRPKRKPSAITQWIYGMANKAREIIKPMRPAAEIVTNESTTGNHIDGLTLQDQPADNSEGTANEPQPTADEPPAQEPAQGDANFTKPAEG